MGEYVSNPFFRLPDELQIRILSLLSTQERVAVSAVHGTQAAIRLLRCMKIEH